MPWLRTSNKIVLQFYQLSQEVFDPFFPILFVSSLEESRCEGEVELIEEGCFGTGANVPRHVSILFADRGNNLPLSQPTVSTLLRFRAAQEVYFNSSLPGMQLHSGNQQFVKELIFSAAAGGAMGPRERCLPYGAESMAFKGGDNCLALMVPFETELFVVRHSVQSLIKWVPMNSAVWGLEGA